MTTKRLPTSVCPRLDVYQMHRGGFLDSGAVSRWKWVLPTADIVVTARVEGNNLLLSLNDSEAVPVRIGYDQLYFGDTEPRGQRAKFTCPACQKGALFLYVHNNTIACRKCLDLAWVSRLPGQRNTTTRKIDRLRAQLVALENKRLAEIAQRQLQAQRTKKLSRARFVRFHAKRRITSGVQGPTR